MIVALFIPLETKSKLWQKQGVNSKENHLGFRCTSPTTREKLRNHPATAEGGMRRGRREAARSPAAAWERGHSSSGGRRLLKGPCPEAHFHRDGPAPSEHQRQFSCAGGTKDLQWDTELLERRPRWDCLCTEVRAVSIVPLLSPPPFQCAHSAPP